jgi:hypothetical protein
MMSRSGQRFARRIWPSRSQDRAPPHLIGMKMDQLAQILEDASSHALPGHEAAERVSCGLSPTLSELSSTRFTAVVFSRFILTRTDSPKCRQPECFTTLRLIFAI